jgi:hypothetical protein
MYNLGNKDALSYTSIKELLLSPEDFWLYVTGAKKKDSEAMRFGRAYDCLLFEPEKFNNQFVFFDDRDIIENILSTYTPEKRATANVRLTTLYKNAKLEFDQSSVGKTVLSEDEHLQIIDMLTALEESGVKDKYLTGGSVQEEFLVDIMGVPVRGRIDYHSPMLRSIRDSKTTGKTVSSFPREARYVYHYDLQAFIYKEAFGAKALEFVVQSKIPPYTVGVFTCSDDFIQAGERKFIQAIERLNAFFKKGSEVSSSKFVYFETL